MKNMSSNLDAVIQDPFGNYIVQYAYETFGEAKCKKITDEIINKFTQYCIQKFSANVVDNLIVNYCTVNAFLFRTFKPMQLRPSWKPIVSKKCWKPQLETPYCLNLWRNVPTNRSRKRSERYYLSQGCPNIQTIGIVISIMLIRRQQHARMSMERLTITSQKQQKWQETESPRKAVSLPKWRSFDWL